MGTNRVYGLSNNQQITINTAIKINIHNGGSGGKQANLATLSGLFPDYSATVPQGPESLMPDRTSIIHVPGNICLFY